MKLSLHLLHLYISIILSQLVNGQNCYYPNGDLSTEGDAPCSSAPGSACCPLNWECLSNGLCFNPAPDLQWYGRYTCTDPTWQSSGCPQICTHDLTASGNEAVLECSTGSYCCDANRPDIDNPPQPGCCNTTTSRFSLPFGNVISSIGVAGTPSSVSPPSTTPTPSPTASNTPTSSPISTANLIVTTSNTPTAIPSSGATSSSAPGSSPTPMGTLSNPSTGTGTPTSSSNTLSAVAASSSPTNTPSTVYVSGPNKLALGLGLGIGIPLALAVIAALVYLIIRHRRNASRERWSSSTLGNTGFYGGADHSVGIEVKPQYNQTPHF